jgi:hypothetical protein
MDVKLNLCDFSSSRGCGINALQQVVRFHIAKEILHKAPAMRHLILGYEEPEGWC